MIYKVPGNGACFQNAAAAHLFQDENLGPKLRIQMNKFLSEHYENYKNIFPCSEEEPFVRQLKGEVVIFKDPEKLKSFLQSSQEAGYLWSDSEDLKILADLYQIKIKTITIKGPTDKNPVVNWIHPDKNLIEFAELKDVEIEDLVLLHEFDSHFDLVVSGNSDLIKFGGLSSREISHQDRGNVSDNKINDRVEKMEQIKNSDKTKVDLEKEIEELKKKQILYEEQYIECERALRRKTEEAERLKTELKDIKLKLSLEDEIRDNDKENETSDDIGKLVEMKDSGYQRNCPSVESSPKPSWKKVPLVLKEEFNCTDCDYQFETLGALQKHTNRKHGKNMEEDQEFHCDVCEDKFCDQKDLDKHKDNTHESRSERVDIEEEFNCNECCYQSNSQEYLLKHIRFTHTMEKYKCQICYYQATGADDLYKHSKNVHGKKQNVTKCEHTCYESDKHLDQKHSLKENIKCRSCGKEFISKSQLMNHRKSEHPNTVAACRDYLEGKCRFDAEKCWWNHKEGKEAEIECFFCDKKFNTKAKVMVHRKNEHTKMVKQCSHFSENRCPFSDETCWYKHEDKIENLVFWEGKKNSRNT